MSIKLNKCEFGETGKRGEHLVAYLYGEVSAQEATAFESHLKGCELCRSELNAFTDLRRSLETWEVERSPGINVAVERGPFEVFKELFSLTPSWLKLGGAAATAAAIVLVALAIAGTRIDWREGAVVFGTSDKGQGQAKTRDGATAPGDLTRAEIETMIADRVRKFREESPASLEAAKTIQEMNSQIASLSEELAEANRSQAKLAASLATVRREQRAMLARGQATLGEWLFASSNNTRDQWGEDNERKN